MKFIKYNSIENSYRDRFISYVREVADYANGWQITEKVHGSNFSFWYDGVELRVASRNQFVDGTFFSCQEVVDRYSGAVMDIFIQLGLNSVENTLTIFGELFGQGIQKGVDYIGGKDFAVFDIMVDGEYLPTKQVEKLAAEYDFYHVPILAYVDTLDEALAFNPLFETKINPKEENFAEGVVIKPNKPLFLTSGARVIIKNKTEAFKENNSPKKKSTRVELTGEDADQYSELSAYLTESRLHSVSSKREYGIKDFGKLLQDMLNDMIADYERDANDTITKIVRKETGRDVANLIRENFQNIVDGNF